MHRIINANDYVYIGGSPRSGGYKLPSSIIITFTLSKENLERFPDSFVLTFEGNKLFFLYPEDTKRSVYERSVGLNGYGKNKVRMSIGIRKYIEGQNEENCVLNQLGKYFKLEIDTDGYGDYFVDFDKPIEIQ